MVHYFFYFFFGGGDHFTSNEQFSLIFVDGNTFHVPLDGTSTSSVTSG